MCALGNTAKKWTHLIPEGMTTNDDGLHPTWDGLWIFERMMGSRKTVPPRIFRICHCEVRLAILVRNEGDGNVDDGCTVSYGTRECNVVGRCE